MSLHTSLFIILLGALTTFTSCQNVEEKPSELIGQWEGIVTKEMKENDIKRFAIQLDENNEMTQILVKNGKESAIVQQIKMKGNTLSTIDNLYESTYSLNHDTLTLTTDKLVIQYVKKEVK